MESLIQDVRYALRGLRRSPAFTLVALLTLARSVAHEEAANGITVNMILPGVIRTGIPARKGALLARKIPARRLGTAQEVARAALFLLSDESGYITGAALTLSGGYLL